MSSHVWIIDDLENIINAIAMTGIALSSDEAYQRGFADALSALAIALGIRDVKRLP